MGEVKEFTTSVDFSEEDNEIVAPPSVKNTYSFECSIESTPELKDFLEEHGKPLKEAQRIADRLNDLIEEYHAPLAPRRERRAIM